ncbi:nitroreductase family protein [Pelomyxa schiedti]|nr:nitroreductase family protein [Pelomyxa schiedti]
MSATGSGNNVERAILERRSVRRYTNVGVPDGVIERLLRAGLWAPSGVNAQPLRVYATKNQEALSELSNKVGAIIPNFKTQPCFYNAPVVIAVAIDTTKEHAMKEKVRTELDVGMALENILLLAHELGLASCVVGCIHVTSQDDMRKPFGMPAHEKVAIMASIGYADEKPVAAKRLPENIKILG